MKQGCLTKVASAVQPAYPTLARGLYSIDIRAGINIDDVGQLNILVLLPTHVIQ